MRATYIDIDLNCIRHNVDVVKRQAPRSKLLAMVKADAYGHGVGNVFAAMDKADGFGVACLSEALALKAAMGQDARPVVLIEGVFGEKEWIEAIQNDFMALIHHRDQLDFALRHKPKPQSRSARVWLKYNTGMNRLGFDEKSALQAGKALLQAGYTLILTSHFACADDPSCPINGEQIARFEALLCALKTRGGGRVFASLCNSAGIFTTNRHYDWVRSGIALYGASPLASQSAAALNLKPAMRFCAQVMAIHRLQAGQSVGYGALWRATKPTDLAIVSAGYGDGYPRAAQNAFVSINQKRCPVVGRVAMDMLAVDIGGQNVALGDTVTLWGDDPSVDAIAACAQTVGYELLCRATARPQRRVFGLLPSP